jgi:EmrB/QacA subfamily drug resistance transporter
MTTNNEATRPSAAQWLVLANVCLGQFIGAVDARSVNVALPTLSVYFGTSMEVVQWIPLAYQLTVVGLVLSLGRLGDAVGRKKIYNSGFVIFMAGSALCGFATGVLPMIFFRVLEGVGGAMILANGRAIASAVFGSANRGKALGITSMAFHMGYIVGPSFGGFLIDTLGWRWIFFVNLPFALSGAVMAWKVLPESVGKKGAYSIDPLGMATLLLSVVFLVVGLHQATRSGFELKTASLLLLSALSLTLFIFFERRTAAPLIELDLFRRRAFSAALVSQALISLSQTATFLLLPFYLQGILSFSPTQVGLTIIFYSVVIVFMAPIGGSLSDRLGSRVLCTAGCTCTFISILSLVRLQATSAQWEVMLPLAGMGLGWSLFASPNLSALFGSVTSERLGAVSGAAVTAANTANAVGIALASLLFSRWLDYYGVPAASAATYQGWLKNPAPYVSAFQNSWAIVAAFALVAVAMSAVRGQRATKS